MTDFEKTGDFTGSASDYAGPDKRCKGVPVDSQVQAALSAPTWTGVMPRLVPGYCYIVAKTEMSRATEGSGTAQPVLGFFGFLVPGLRLQRYWSVNRA